MNTKATATTPTIPSKRKPRPTQLTSDEIVAHLFKLAKTRPGIDPGDYISRGRPDPDGALLYRRACREATRDLGRVKRAHAMLGPVAVEYAAELVRRGNRRLVLDGRAVKYREGQYYPTEYRDAIAGLFEDAIAHARYLSRGFA